MSNVKDLPNSGNVLPLLHEVLWPRDGIGIGASKMISESVNPQ